MDNVDLNQLVILLTANKYKGNACAEIVKQALIHPKIFVFGELLGHPNVRELESTHKPLFDLLKIFASGTYAEYLVKQERGENLPRLSAIETTKLQRLSLVSVASEHHSLEYKHLMGILRVESVRALEDLVLDSVAAGLIEGQLDQKRGVFEVQYAMGRDIGANDVDKMLNKLNDWLSHSAIVRQELKNRHAHANSAIEKTTAAEKKITDERAKLIEDILKEREEKKRKDASAGRMGAGPGQARGRGPFL